MSNKKLKIKKVTNSGFVANGFTLIELLVVISIISLISSIVMASLNSARISARDTQRISDIRQIRIALELYKSDHGDYPTAGPWIISNNSNWDSTLGVALAPYISKLPRDPINNTGVPWGDGGYTYAYGYNTGMYSYGITKRYDLATQFENPTNQYRCEVRQWTTGWDGTIWCGPYSKYLYTGEY